jgi:hypothetical protein
MGKPKKGGFPAVQPKTNYVDIKNGEIDNAIIAWGDSVVWTNFDATEYTLAGLTNGEPDSANVWAVVAANSSSNALVFTWKPGIPKDPQVYHYGMLKGGKAKAQLTVQILV